MNQPADVEHLARAAADGAPGGEPQPQRVSHDFMLANLFGIVLEIILLRGARGAGQGHRLQAASAQGEQSFRRHAGAAVPVAVAKNVRPADVRLAVVQRAHGRGWRRRPRSAARFPAPPAPPCATGPRAGRRARFPAPRRIRRGRADPRRLTPHRARRPAALPPPAPRPGRTTARPRTSAKSLR